jgi:hypothetical protein
MDREIGPRSEKNGLRKPRAEAAKDDKLRQASCSSVSDRRGAALAGHRQDPVYFFSKPGAISARVKEAAPANYPARRFH